MLFLQKFHPFGIEKPRSGGIIVAKIKDRKPSKPRSGGIIVAKIKGRKPSKPRSGGIIIAKIKDRKPSKPRSGGIFVESKTTKIWRRERIHRFTFK